MAGTAEIQELLRFLTQEAKLPLSTAISRVKDLREAKLLNPEDISNADTTILRSIFKDEKSAKQVANAAKRALKKRPADTALVPSSKKRKKLGLEAGSPSHHPLAESDLVLPIATNLDKISSAVVSTNRAPLVLAFAFIVIKYTMPEQPISSRLSLAQAVVSANSRTKASSIGLEPKPSAEDEGWAKGQPTVKILGREISVLKRWGYSGENTQANDDAPAPSRGAPEQETKADTIDPAQAKQEDDSPALWGLDLEALRKSKSPVVPGYHYQGNPTLPVYQSESARDYLLRACTLHEAAVGGKRSQAKSKKGAVLEAAKGECLGLLLGAIDALCKSWASTLGKDELDRRAWGWYVAVRPEVSEGASGWGQKGLIPLRKILDLRR